MRLSGMAALLLGLGVAAPVYAQGLAQPMPIAATLSRDVAFGREIALIRADITTADELVKARNWSLAARHASFPMEEIYGVIRENMRVNRIPPFDGALRAYRDVVKGKSARQYPKALAVAQAGLDRTESLAKAKQTDPARYTLAVALAMVQTASEEYQDAALRNPMRAVDYQGVRGMLAEAERLLMQDQAALTARNAEAYTSMRDKLSALRTFFAPLDGPKVRPIEPADFSARLREIASAAEPLR